MTSRVLITTENPALPSNIRFASEAAGLNIEVIFINPYEHIGPLPGFDAALIRTTGYRYDDSDLELLQCATNVFNSPDVLMPLRDKWKQACQFTKLGLPHPQTWRLQDYPGDLNEVVLKTLRGSKGLGVEFVFGRQNIQKKISEILQTNDLRYLIQETVQHFREFRVFYSFGEILGIVEKLPDPNKKEWRRNTCISPDLTKPLRLEQIPSEVIKLISNSVQQTRVDIAGFDILLTQDNAYLLEINFVPGFKYLEERLELNIAKKILVQTLKQF